MINLLISILYNLPLQSNLTPDRNTPTPSEEFPYHKLNSRPHHGRFAQDMDGNSTFPSRKPNPNERIRIPSTQSVASRSSTGRISIGSMDRGIKHL